MSRKIITAVAAVTGTVLFAGTAFADFEGPVRIATEGAYAPFNAIDSGGQLVGFDVEIANALCEAMGAECEIVAQDWDGIIPGLLAGNYDAIVASMSITDERKQQVDFTDPYYSNFLRFVAGEGSGIGDIGDLEDKAVGAQRATISSQYLEDNMAGDVEIKLYDTQDAAYLDLRAGRIDAMLTDVYPAYDWMQQADNSGYVFVADQIDIDDKIGIAVRQEDDELREALNEALAEIRANGTYAEINARYFPFDIY